MSQLPVDLEPGLAARLRRALDPEAKVARGLDALGPIAGRDVLVVDGDGSPVIEAMAGLGARITTAPLTSPLALPAADGSVDVVVGLWTSFRGPAAADEAEVDRVLRPGGRQLVVHDYGRDDVSRLFAADRPEYRAWSQRTGPFLVGGFRIRVLHCWWAFETIDDARDFLAAAFGVRGVELGQSLRRPRLSYKVAIYHRDRGAAADLATDAALAPAVRSA